MSDLTILSAGYRTIQLYRKIGGNNFWKDSIQWEVCGNVLVDECDFKWLSQYRWLMQLDTVMKSYYAYRYDKLLNSKRRVLVFMAREILNLPPGVGNRGDQADHKNHDIRDNRRDNLRKATVTQNHANGRTTSIRCRFKGVSPSGSGFRAKICYNSQSVDFLTVKIDVEAALMYNYAADLLFEEFAHLNWILEDEMPSYERQVELYDMVVKKLTNVGLLGVTV